MKVACSPRVVVPLVLGIGIIAVLLGYANVGRVLQAASTFQPRYFLLILLLTLAYEALRAVQWLLLLRELNHRKAWRSPGLGDVEHGGTQLDTRQLHAGGV